MVILLCIIFFAARKHANLKLLYYEQLNLKRKIRYLQEDKEVDILTIYESRVNITEYLEKNE